MSELTTVDSDVILKYVVIQGIYDEERLVGVFDTLELACEVFGLTPEDMTRHVFDGGVYYEFYLKPSPGFSDYDAVYIYECPVNIPIIHVTPRGV